MISKDTNLTASAFKGRTIVKRVNLNAKLANRFDVVSTALPIDVPLSVQRDGTAYKVELVAVDALGNVSETVSSEIR